MVRNVLKRRLPAENNKVPKVWLLYDGNVIQYITLKCGNSKEKQAEDVTMGGIDSIKDYKSDDSELSDTHLDDDVEDDSPNEVISSTTHTFSTSKPFLQGANLGGGEFKLDTSPIHQERKNSPKRNIGEENIPENIAERKISPEKKKKKIIIIDNREKIIDEIIDLKNERRRTVSFNGWDKPGYWDSGVESLTTSKFTRIDNKFVMFDSS